MSVIFYLKGARNELSFLYIRKNKKNGHIHNGKQNYRCKECGRQFVEYPEKKNISNEYKEFIKKMLLERLSLRGICRVTNVSLTWLLGFFRQITDDIPDDMGAVKTEKGKISIEIDEMWSYAGKKKNKRWIWLAVDRATGQIVGFRIGGRGKKMRKNFGNPCQASVVSVPFAILIFGKHTNRLSPNAVTVPPEKGRDRQIVSREQIVLCVSGFPDWSERLFPFPKVPIIISVQ